MSLDQLLHEAAVHYRSRGFPESALVHLRWILVANAKDGEIRIDTAYTRYHRKIEDLLDRFHPCSESPIETEPSPADAVFGFAFGYQMKAWSKEHPPTDKIAVEADRAPGANNLILADHAMRLRRDHNLELYLQFEIADAGGKRADIEYASAPMDQGTFAVASEFISHAKRVGKQIRSVVLVAHRHHFERCRLILERKNITSLPTADRYSGYDPLECQPRVMSPEEYILSDFVSMAAMF